VGTSTSTQRNFILQQGFEEVSPVGCSLQYSALHFQPRIVLAWLIVAIIFKSTIAFLALAAVLWFSALLPELNPFDAVYNRTIGRRRGFLLGPAPPPRRTAQTIAGALALAAALFIHYGFSIAAYIVEAIFLAAVLALTFGGFCLGSYLYHLVRGRTEFARNTLPWAH
jgi:hypothetical protein